MNRLPKRTRRLQIYNFIQKSTSYLNIPTTSWLSMNNTPILLGLLFLHDSSSTLILYDTKFKKCWISNILFIDKWHHPSTTNTLQSARRSGEDQKSYCVLSFFDNLKSSTHTHVSPRSCVVLVLSCKFTKQKHYLRSKVSVKIKKPRSRSKVSTSKVYTLLRKWNENYTKILFFLVNWSLFIFVNT